jgi:hypothetical protein
MATTYTERLQPIPLVADRNALREAKLTSLARAALITVRRVREPATRMAWRDDGDVELILRSAVAPASTANASALTTIKLAFVAALTPVSAAAAVIARSLQLSFDGALQIGIPALTMPQAKWISEGAPIPVVKGSSSPGPMISPYKIAVITSLTNELIARSNAESVIRQVLIENTGPTLDAAMFSAAAGTPGLQPPGLLHGIAALTASTATGYDAMVSDVGDIVQALAGASGAGPALVIAAPKQALALGLAARDPLTVLASAALPVGTVVGVVPQAVATEIGAPRLDAAKEATMHMDDTPAEIVGTGGAVASPSVISVYQADSTALRLIMPATWGLRSPSAVAWMQDVKW